MVVDVDVDVGGRAHHHHYHPSGGRSRGDRPAFHGAAKVAGGGDGGGRGGGGGGGGGGGRDRRSSLSLAPPLPSLRTANQMIMSGISESRLTSGASSSLPSFFLLSVTSFSLVPLDTLRHSQGNPAQVLSPDPLTRNSKGEACPSSGGTPLRPPRPPPPRPRRPPPPPPPPGLPPPSPRCPRRHRRSRLHLHCNSCRTGLRVSARPPGDSSNSNSSSSSSKANPGPLSEGEGKTGFHFPPIQKKKHYRIAETFK